ncbi:MAG: FtsX-like permease family protein, partial [Erysipelotrichaceae bacterium]
MKNGMRKDLWREIRRSMGRFLSLLLIVALGVGFFVGVKATAPSMKYSATLFFEEQNLHDFHLLSDYGFVDADLNALQQISGVEAVMPGYSADLIVRLEGRNRVMRVLSMPMQTIRNPEVIDAPYLVEGRLPEADDECVVEINQIIPDSIQIGDVIEVEAPDDTTDLSELVHQSSFTVVGLVESPIYISVERGITTVGDGTIAGYMLINSEVFAYPRYSDVYLQTNATFDPKNVFADPYFEEIKAQAEKLQVVSEQRLLVNREEIIALGQAEIDKQTQIWEAAVQEGRIELNNGQKALADGLATLNENKATLEQAKIRLAQAQQELLNNQANLRQAQVDLNAARQNYNKQLLDGQAKIDKGWTQYNAGIASYNQGIKDYEAGLAQYNDGLAKYNAALSDYNAGLAKYNAAYADYQAGLDEYNQGLAQYNAQKAELDQKRADLAAAKAQLADLQQGINLLQALYDLMVATPDTPLVPTIYLLQQAVVSAGNFSASQQAWFDNEIAYIVNNAGEGATFGSAAPLVSGRIAMYQQQYNEGQAQVAEAQKQIDAGQAQLDAAKVELDNAKKTLDASKAQLDDTKAQLDAAKAQLDETKAQLDASKKQLDASKAQLDASQVELANSKKQLEASQVSLARQKTDGAASLDAAQRKIDAGWIQLEEAKEQIALNQKKIEAGQQELAQAQKDYDAKVLEFEAAEKQYDAQVASGKQQLLDAQNELESLELGKWYIFTRDDNPGYADFADDASRIAGIADVFPVFFFVVAALVCLTTMTRMVEENRTQSGTLKALGYSDWAISSKYFYYALLATLIGCVLGGIIGINLFPKVIFGAYSDMYTLPHFAIAQSAPTFAIAMLGAFLSTCTVALFVAYRELKEEPAQLMRPKAPKAGKRIFLERIPLLWTHFSFSSKVTARNLFRYKSRFIMTVFGVAGCTALILSAYALQNAVGVIVPQQFGVIQNFDGTMSARYAGTGEEKAAFMQVLKGDSR